MTTEPTIQERADEIVKAAEGKRPTGRTFTVTLTELANGSARIETEGDPVFGARAFHRDGPEIVRTTVMLALDRLNAKEPAKA